MAHIVSIFNYSSIDDEAPSGTVRVRAWFISYKLVCQVWNLSY